MMKFVIFVALFVSALALPADYNTDDHAEELDNQFQGDMIISQAEIDSFNGLIADRYRWENNIVPYSINMALFNAEQAAYIHLAAQRINDLNCVTLVNRTTEADYIEVSGDSTGCSSYVGRQGGRQLLRLAPNVPESGCFRLYTIVHEFIHALGFHHMQSSYDRDEFVRIVWENIQAGTENNFSKYGTDRITHFGAEYDFDSVMHYGPTGFSINGEATIVPLHPLGGIVMGQRTHMSENDQLRVKRMYGCAPVPHKA